MTEQRWSRIKEVFELAVEQTDLPSMTQLLVWCDQDEELCGEVHRLLEEDRRIEQERQLDPLKVARQNPTLPESARARFDFLAPIGCGTFGDVFKVHDKTRGSIVALKILRDPNPSGLLYFKREFRSLSDVRHPNLVRLHELISGESQWMFTMEFVQGVPFLDYVRRDGQVEAGLRETIPQLAAALEALHSRGLLHRDLKPSNVLVAGDGRLTVLDFGLVRALDEDSSRTLAGTPDYMSPEQAEGGKLTAASDWYAVGVMLYQALTGELPFTGPLLEVLQHKKSQRPRPPRDRDPGIPSSLNDLCLGLLDPDPEVRMRHATASSAIASFEADVPRPLQKAGTAHSSLLVGREAELQQLQVAFEQIATKGRPAAVHLCAPSGVGKSVLMREFLNRLRVADPSILIFAGRCYESESVPFQGIDDLIDHITQYLRRLPSGELAQLLPRNVALMVRMFPVLGQLKSPDSRLVPPPVDSAELRSRAFAAVRDMLGRIAERHRVVLAIDDLQWGDRDGCEFLSALLASAEAPPLLMIAAYRNEDVDALPHLRSLRETGGVTLVELGPLSPPEAARLALLQAGGAGLDDETIQEVVGQSGGHPFLIQQAVHWMLHNRTNDNPAPKGFEAHNALIARFDRLPSAARRLLESVAVSGQPIALSVLKRLHPQPGLVEAKDLLLAEHLLRSRSVAGNDEVEVYHDRIRASVVACISPRALRECHAGLASAYEAGGNADPETLAIHYFNAGESGKAAANARLAAGRASEALAFNKASRFYRLAIEVDSDPIRTSELFRALGDSLSNAGRGREAAEAYLEAAKGAQRIEGILLRGKASSQLLRCGHVERGRELLTGVIRDAGIRTPASPALQLAHLAFLRLKLRKRGLDFRERRSTDIAPADLLRVDLCGGAAQGLGMTDPLTSALYSTRFLWYALEAGEPSRIALAMSGEAPQTIHTGGKASYARAHELLSRASAIAATVSDPRVDATILMMSGIVAYLEGKWRKCIDDCTQAAQLLRLKCSRISWELGTASTFAFIARSNSGEWIENRRQLPGLIREAEARGDLHATYGLRILGSVYNSDLAVGQAEKAWNDLQDDLAHWPVTGSSIQRSAALLAKVDISLYLNRPEDGWLAMQEEWPALERTGFLRLSTPSAFSQSCRGRIAIAMAERDPRNADRYLKIATESAEFIFKRCLPWSRGLAHLLHAGVASFQDALAARQQLELAASEAGNGGTSAFRVAALYRLWQLTPQGDGLQMPREVEDWALRQEVTDLVRVIARIAPGKWRVAEGAAT